LLKEELHKQVLVLLLVLIYNRQIFICRKFWRFFTISQDTDVPSGQGFAKSMKFDCTTANASPATSGYLLLQQRIEGQNLQYLKKGTSSAESVTMSFWVKSNKTGTYILN
jgi:hypothetical protein